MKTAILAGLFVCASHPATGLEQTGWVGFTHLTLSIGSPESNDQPQWRYRIARNGDLEIVIDGKGTDQQSGGEIMLLSGGKAVLMRGVDPATNAEIDVLDAPVLALQLLNNLIYRILMDDPAALDGPYSLDILDRNSEISVGTITASGVFAPPWRLSGDLGPADNHYTNFDLRLVSAEHGYDIHLSGGWQVADMPPSFPDNMTLHEWTLYRFGPIQRPAGDGSIILDYGMKPQDQPHRTLGALRAALHAEATQP